MIVKALGLNRTYCYSLLKPPVPKPKRPPVDKDALVKQRIRKLCEAFPTYGYRRIQVMLRRRSNLRVNHKRVYRLMKEMGLLVKSSRRGASRTKRQGRFRSRGPMSISRVT
ncbi:MAG: transposase [Alicyclobacillaceae bacterium]|nr:transposase [Alicyclobacillaceae bacterium]